MIVDNRLGDYAEKERMWKNGKNNISLMDFFLMVIDRDSPQLVLVF